jgi:hypothetical protein
MMEGGIKSLRQCEVSYFSKSLRVLFHLLDLTERRAIVKNRSKGIKNDVIDQSIMAVVRAALVVGEYSGTLYSGRES